MEQFPVTLVSQYLLALDTRLTAIEAALGGVAPQPQAPNTVLAGPATAPAAAPTFRALVAADIPVLAEIAESRAARRRE